MKKYLCSIVALFVCQLFLTQVCHIDGKYLLLAEAKESDRGFTEDSILPADAWPERGATLPSEPTVFKGVTKKAITKIQKDRYSIRMYYPSFGNKDLDASIKAWAESYTDEFVQDALNDYEEMKDAFFKWEMVATYSITQASPNAISVLFRIYVYTGGAHGGFRYIAHTFDKNSWNEIPNSLFFTDQKRALTAISDYCRADFATREDFVNDPGVLEGTAPTPDNFDIVVPRPGGLLVVFYPGQISCFAAGTLTVFVPLEKFREYIEPGKIWR